MKRLTIILTTIFVTAITLSTSTIAKPIQEKNHTESQSLQNSNIKELETIFFIIKEKSLSSNLENIINTIQNENQLDLETYNGPIMKILIIFFAICQAIRFFIISPIKNLFSLFIKRPIRNYLFRRFISPILDKIKEVLIQGVIKMIFRTILKQILSPIFELILDIIKIPIY